MSACKWLTNCTSLLRANDKSYGEDARMKQRICILSFSFISRDARVLRQVEYLADRFLVTIIGYGQLNVNFNTAVQAYSVNPPDFWQKVRKLLLLILGRILTDRAYEFWYWKEKHHKTALDLITKSRPRVIHANDWITLPLAAKASEKTGAHIVLDLHEYAPLEWESRRYWKIFYKPMVDYLLKKYMPHVSASVTVGEAIAGRYFKEYGFRPAVIMNTPRPIDSPAFRKTNTEAIRLVHHGGAIRDRRLELMIQTVALADSRYTLHFMLIESSRGYLSYLRTLAQRTAPGRVFFHQPVPPADIIRNLSGFDMGIYLLPLTDFNHSFALPNKFFDFVMAGLSVCVGPSPEMANIARQFGFGAVAQSFEPSDVARVLNYLTASEIDEMKLRAIEASKFLNADMEMRKLIALYFELLGEKECAVSLEPGISMVSK